MSQSRPKTGDKRQVRQPLHIDKLPVEVRDEIQKLKAEGYTWSEIEERSAKFVKWEELPTRVLELFPQMHIPRSNLQRWYDLRIEQVREESMARAEVAREHAAAMSGREFKKLPEAIRSLLGDLLFSLTERQDEKSQAVTMKMATELGWLMQEYRLNDIKQQKVELESKRVTLAERQLEMKKSVVDKVTNEAAKKLGKGKGITVDDINRIRERTFGLPPVQRSASTGNTA
ncbi:MAG: hypothetical protein JWN45_2937 [Acidobacteriaceae bacterium]|nr:hypothetical protein [Acidobacteriaceae bacterium]